jgi:hypothetical protein
MTSPTNGFSFVIDAGNGNTNGYTNTTNGSANTDATTGLMEKIVTSTGAANAGCTLGTSQTWNGIIYTIEETPTAAAAATRIPSIGQ